MARASSYTSTRGGVAALARQAGYLYRRERDPAARVDEMLRRLHEVERAVAETYGMALVDKRVLDIGTGQLLGQLAYFSRHTDAVGIDLDVIAQDRRPGSYLRMLRVNGVKRTVKTLVRIAFGIDARFRAELARRIGPFGRLDVRLMDVCDLAFEDESFDFVHCESILQHVPEPARALQEIRRVLRPGGVFYAHWHLYTSNTGSLDPRATTEDFPRWAHLRPEHAGGTTPSAYVNKLRLPEWRRLCTEFMPGHVADLRQPEFVPLESEARQLQQAGALTDFDLEELVTQSVAVLWQKPPTAAVAV
jgi:SAM-dependent methyltransferase